MYNLNNLKDTVKKKSTLRPDKPVKFFLFLLQYKLITPSAEKTASSFFNITKEDISIFCRKNANIPSYPPAKSPESLSMTAAQ